MLQPKSLLDDFDDTLGGDESGLLRFVVGPAHSGHRLDKVLAQLLPEHSRARIQGWIEEGHVRVNDQVHTRPRRLVASGDEVLVRIQASAQALAFAPQEVDFTVLAETDDWLVVDKRAGLVVHPGAGNWQGTLLNGLLFRYPELATVARAGIVHRLDKDTTGLMVVARTETAQTHLVRQLQDRTVRREYRALVHGWLAVQSMTVDRPIGRDPSVPVRMAVSVAGPAKTAITRVRRLRRGRLDDLPVTEVSCQLETGRTHQIRVHLASLKHPLVGDTLYGGKAAAGAARQMLHAQSLSFIDPGREQWVTFESPLPDDMVSVLGRVHWSASEMP